MSRPEKQAATSDAEPGLRRTMHGFGALLITLSALSPSIGLFIVGSEVLHQAGTATFVCFLAAALLGVAMACVYGELGSAFPDTGGEYTIVGRVLGPSAGFSMLGLLLTGFSIAQALSGLGMVEYLQVAWPGLPQVPAAIAIVVLVTLIGVLNIRINAWVTGLCLAVELLAIILVAVLGFAHPHRGVMAAVAHPVMLSGHGELIPATLAVMGLSAVGAIYAFNGYGGVIFLGEELHEAPKRLAKVVFWALGIAAVTELVPLLAILMGAPDLKVLIGDKHPVPAFLTAAGGAPLARAMALGVALAFFNTMIAVALMAGRMLYATGRDKVWPEALNRAFSRLHPRFNSPWIATLVMGATSVVWCLAPRDVLILVLGNGNVAFYAALCLAALQGRRTGATDHAGWRMPAFPLAPALALLALIGVIWAAVTDPERGRPGLLVTVAVLAISAAYYQLVLKRKGRWAHRGEIG